jgi:hypothetical protein
LVADAHGTSLAYFVDPLPLVSDKVTAIPPVGAAFDKVTVQVELAPERIAVGVHCKAVTAAVPVPVEGVTVTEAIAVLSLRVAVTVAA